MGYTQADPIGLEGGWNRFTYVGGNAIGFIDPEGLYTEVIQWGTSPGMAGSWGHISGNINGRNYSFGSGGWGTRYPTAQEYADRQKSPDIDRTGEGIILDLTPKEEADLGACLLTYSNYSGYGNNCGNPWLECLEKIGVANVRGRPRVLPADVMKILRDSNRARGQIRYRGTRPLYIPK